MKKIANQTFPSERALYNENNAEIINCRFEGEEDGESALKECSQILMKNCFMDLRYPLWHVNGVSMHDCEQTVNCRAALWYSKDITVVNSKLNGIKALRECKNVSIANSTISSAEFGWRCRDISANASSFESEYIFFMSERVVLDNIKLKGKYSFQYVNDLKITNSELDTKDSFWHSKNVTVKNSRIKGEYLAWYAENLTLIGCEIIGTQPLCYCKGLKLIDCSMEGCDLSFEKSEVDATLTSHVDSIKNPISGSITLPSLGELIDEYHTICKIEVTKCLI